MLQNCSIINVAGVFFKEPTKNHYLIEISKKSKLAHTSTKKHLITLKKQKIIKQINEKKGKRNFPGYIANLDNPIYKQKKKMYNLSKLYECRLIEFLKDKFTPKTILVFGSYVHGEDIENSDIDIFIESKKEDINLTKFEIGRAHV